jgi:hypothetical protein
MYEHHVIEYSHRFSTRTDHEKGLPSVDRAGCSSTVPVEETRARKAMSLGFEQVGRHINFFTVLQLDLGP